MKLTTPPLFLLLLLLNTLLLLSTPATAYSLTIAYRTYTDEPAENYYFRHLDRCMSFKAYKGPVSHLSFEGARASSTWRVYADRNCKQAIASGRRGRHDFEVPVEVRSYRVTSDGRGEGGADQGLAGGHGG